MKQIVYHCVVAFCHEGGKMSEVRTPQQERSIAKKKKIIEAGYDLFSRVGYHATNTAEIAKHAGVSTGIVYGYFKDKRDILLDVLDIYLDKALAPVLTLFDRLTAPINFDKFIPKIIDTTIDIHRHNANIHEALHAMSASDEAVNIKFLELEDKMTSAIANKLKSLGVDVDGMEEKIHLAIGIVQSFSHECIFDNHHYLNYDKMRDVCISVVKSMFEN